MLMNQNLTVHKNLELEMVLKYMISLEKYMREKTNKYC